MTRTVSRAEFVAYAPLTFDQWKSEEFFDRPYRPRLAHSALRQALPERQRVYFVDREVYVGPRQRRPSVVRRAWQRIRRSHWDHVVAVWIIIACILIAVYGTGNRVEVFRP